MERSEPIYFTGGGITNLFSLYLQAYISVCILAIYVRLLVIQFQYRS